MKSCTLKFKVMILHQKKGGVLTLGWGGIAALNAGVCVSGVRGAVLHAVMTLKVLMLWLFYTPTLTM